MNYTISLEQTNSPKILKFKADKILIEDNTSIEVTKIMDTSKYPLVSKLMQFPFVEKIYASGDFIAIEKSDALDWMMIQDELRETIENLLNSGVEIKQKSVLTPTTVYIENTPNMEVQKFVLNSKLTDTQYEFYKGDSFEKAPFIAHLFQEFNFIEQIYVKDNYVAVTKSKNVNWADVQSDLREAIRNYVSNKESLSLGDLSIAKISPSKDLDPVSKKIVDVLKEYIEPAVSSDGGNIELESYNQESKEVVVLLRGACSGCPSSTMTLKNGVEQTLKNILGEDLIGDVIAK